MAEKPKFGFRVVGTILDVKGSCNAGHKKGDAIELRCPDHHNQVTMWLKRFPRG